MVLEGIKRADPLRDSIEYNIDEYDFTVEQELYLDPKTNNKESQISINITRLDSSIPNTAPQLSLASSVRIFKDGTFGASNTEPLTSEQLAEIQNILKEQAQSGETQRIQITMEQFEKLPDGTELINRDGKKVIKGVDDIDDGRIKTFLYFVFLQDDENLAKIQEGLNGTR
jgi:hypothetical protein